MGKPIIATKTKAMECLKLCLPRFYRGRYISLTEEHALKIG
jgi:hypothetical protein